MLSAKNDSHWGHPWRYIVKKYFRQFKLKSSSTSGTLIPHKKNKQTNKNSYNMSCNFSIVMVVTNSDLDFICQPDVEFLAERPFAYCPKHFFFSKYTPYMGIEMKCILLVSYFLPPDKKRPTYLRMFDMLKESTRQNKLKRKSLGFWVVNYKCRQGNIPI